MMKGTLSALLAFCVATALPTFGEEFLTLTNLPMGTRDTPLVLRTFFPDPGLGREVIQNHDLGARARKYKPGTGDVDGFVDPIEGIPSAIGVNFGPDLSLCWDAAECRLLYAWQGGFLDMTNYWGEPEAGRRKGFGYVPALVGNLIYVTKGSHPLAILDEYTANHSPQFLGYAMKDGVPEFEYQLGSAKVQVRIEPGEAPMSLIKHYRISGIEKADYYETGYKMKLDRTSDTEFSVTIDGKIFVPGGGDDEPTFSTDKPNREWGESLYTSLGCLACHSTDGTRGHGPSFAGLFGAERKIAGVDELVTADEAYIFESIQNPQAKVVDTFPPGYMPPYPLEEKQLNSLLLFIQSLAKE